MRGVVADAIDYLGCVSALTPPDRLYVSQFSRTGALRPLAELSRRVARGDPATATASLIVREGLTDRFRIRGTHAEATIAKPSAYRGRVVCCAVLLAVVVLAALLVCWTRGGRGAPA